LKQSSSKIESKPANINNIEKVLVQKWLICSDDSRLHRREKRSATDKKAFNCLQFTFAPNSKPLMRESKTDSTREVGLNVFCTNSTWRQSESTLVGPVLF